MSTETYTDVVELQAVAQAAESGLVSELSEEPLEGEGPRVALAGAVSAAMAAGHSLEAIVDAERAGKARVRESMGGDLLRRLRKAGQKRRELERECEELIRTAGRLGVAHREIADAAGVAASTIRAALTRAPREPDSKPSADGASTAEDKRADFAQGVTASIAR